MKKSIIWKFFSACVFSTFIAVFVLNFYVSLEMKKNVEQKISERLRTNAILAGSILKDQITFALDAVIQQKVASLAEQLQFRITVIDAKGKVLADSQKSPELMGNHLDREEIAMAITDGFGSSTRFSTTLGYEMKYVATRIDAQDPSLGVVRFAIPLSDVQLQVRLVYRAVLFGGITAIVIALIIAYFVARTITSPIRKMQVAAQRIAQGDFDKKIKVRGDDELGELAKSLNMMAEELQTQIKNLKHMDQVRTDFVANVSHELKTPLTSIKGFAETLQDGAINNKEDALRFIGIIKKHTDRLENIVNDLLSLSELEDKKDEFEKVTFDLKFLIEDIVKSFAHAIAEKRQTLQVDTSEKEINIKADRYRISQVFVNLIANAIKYSEEGKKIMIFLSTENGTVNVTVEDQGIGIPAEHLSRVFERFYRVDKVRSSQAGGTGLGLGIAKHIVLAHKGTISIESKPGQGTKVHVILPV